MSENPPPPKDDRLDRFVSNPGDSIIYGPDGKPWKPGDPIPARNKTDTDNSSK
ncbi:hypothetical protein ThrDRAFT_01096 [Frankia casuarinae]|jgi:hypothetical protein|uniref:hypothetical protein n=1 Tax=Frankia TaxID=1854 RepID=UPI000053AB85|nr:MULTISPECIES: hypothetical protein [Frankia]EYT93126.1 hypothetical protein ThrDRAFT_01096 [Frankia casuarinae]KEZ35980.1 hypothetical protein CEDDRAFT_02710 [Frankia sp. CeD]